MRKQKTYILYNYNKFNKDIEYLKEYQSINDLTNDFKQLKNKKSIYQYIKRSIDNLKDIKLLNDRYIIISQYYDE